jgi:hypothetical protein
MNRPIWGATLLCLVVLAGCGRTTKLESLPTFPAEGKVLVRGKPAEGVQVFFHPREPSQRGKPRGITGADGRFQLRTYRDGDGAPAGEYTITVYWPGPYNPKLPKEDQIPPDRLGERFMNPKSSTLRATIAAGPNTLAPIEIQ